jgi:hypothetical protein
MRKVSKQVSEPTPQETSITGVISAVRFTATYGFIDEFGDTWHWRPGQVVRNPYVLSLISTRSAPVESI